MLVKIRPRHPRDKKRYYYGVSDFHVVDDGVMLAWPTTADRPAEEVVEGNLMGAVSLRVVNDSGFALQIQDQRDSENINVMIEPSRDFPELADYTED